MRFLQYISTLRLVLIFSRASRVDIKKLEKQEAKLKAKIEKRSKRDLYEGSKLLDQARKQVMRYSVAYTNFSLTRLPQQSYEEMFMKASALRSGLRLQLITHRSIHLKLLPLLRTRVKTYTSQIWKSTSPQIVSCEWTIIIRVHVKCLIPSKVRGQTSPSPTAEGTVSLVVTASLISGECSRNLTSVN